MPKCYQKSLKETNILEDDYIIENMGNVERKLGLKMTNSTSKINAEIEMDTLKTAGEMFTYLNHCPPGKLLSFYQHCFKNNSLKKIIFALIR